MKESKTVQQSEKGMTPSASTVYARIACANRMWFFVSILLMACTVLCLLAVLSAQRATKQEVIILDQSGNFLVGKKDVLEDSREIMQDTAEWATEAFFARNEKGFEHWNRIEKLFSEKMQERIQSERQKEQKEFQENKYAQRSSINRIEIKRIEEKWKAIVSGRVIREGVFNNVEKFTVSVNFQFSMNLQYNGKIDKSSRYYPFIVTDYGVKFEQVKQKEIEEDQESEDMESEE